MLARRYERDLEAWQTLRTHWRWISSSLDRSIPRERGNTVPLIARGLAIYVKYSELLFVLASESYSYIVQGKRAAVEIIAGKEYGYAKSGRHSKCSYTGEVGRMQRNQEREEKCKAGKNDHVQLIPVLKALLSLAVDYSQYRLNYYNQFLDRYYLSDLCNLEERLLRGLNIIGDESNEPAADLPFSAKVSISNVLTELWFTKYFGFNLSQVRREFYRCIRDGVRQAACPQYGKTMEYPSND